MTGCVDFYVVVRHAPVLGIEELCGPRVCVDCPPFPSVAAHREGQLMVSVHPCVQFPAFEKRVREVLGDDRVERDGRRIAVVQFHADDGAELAAHQLEAEHLWCGHTLRRGWRIWDIGLEDGLPCCEVILAEDGIQFAGGAGWGQGLSPILLVVPTEHSIRVHPVSPVVSSLADRCAAPLNLMGDI